MQGFKKALDLQTGAEMNDGNYVFKDNDYVTLNGIVKGTSRDALVVDITAYVFSELYYDEAKFENATIKLTTSTVNTWGHPVDDGGQLPSIGHNNAHWNFKNVSFIGTRLTAIFMPYAIIENSDVTIDFSDDGFAGYDTQIQFSGSTASNSEIKNSTITLNNTFHGITAISDSANLEFTNSKININVSGNEELSRDGTSTGILLQGGHVKIENSELNITTQNAYQSPVVLSGSSSFTVGENTVINTPASNDKSDEISYLIDNIVALETAPTGYVVTGGSFLVKYHTDTGADLSTTPTNGLANGNEKLTYFQLADSSVTSLSPLNKNGQRYTYGVANASSDGNKYVWVPSEKVTFSLGDNPSATFADGTNTNKETLAMRGNAITMAVRANDEAIPTFNTTPISNDASKQFKGWFYRDASGNVLPFDANTTDVLETMNVFAMWEEVPQPTVTPTQPSQPNAQATPKTSDNTNIGYQFGMLFISLGAVVVLLKARNLVAK